jgi:hypothetical protein
MSLAEEEVDIHFESAVFINISTVTDLIARATTRRARITIYLCNRILAPFYGTLDEDMRTRFLQMLAEGTIVSVGHLDVPLFVGADILHRRCFRLVCEALGSNVHLNSAGISLRNDVVLCGLVAGSLQQIKKITFCRSTDGDLAAVPEELTDATMQAVATSLHEHPSLKEVTLLLSTQGYRLILPALQTISTMSYIALGCAEHHNFCTLAPQDAQALSDLMHWQQPIELELECFDISKTPFQQFFVDGIAGARIHGLTMNNCEMDSVSHGVAIADAMAHSQLKSIIVYYAPRVATVWTGFLSTLAAGFPNMLSLESLDLQFGALEFTTDPTFHDAVLALIRAAGKGPGLTCLRLAVTKYSERMDQALAVCLCNNAVLQTLQVTCPFPQGSTEFQAHQSPALLEAMAYNHTLQNIYFDSNNTIEPSGIDPWDADLKKMISAILQLNRQGRAYLKEDGPQKQAKGVRLLSKVNEEMDCIFYHVREFPDLCAQNL